MMFGFPWIGMDSWPQTVDHVLTIAHLTPSKWNVFICHVGVADIMFGSEVSYFFCG